VTYFQKKRKNPSVTGNIVNLRISCASVTPETHEKTLPFRQSLSKSHPKALTCGLLVRSSFNNLRENKRLWALLLQNYLQERTNLYMDRSCPEPSLVSC
jgi:hypothetical protein